MMEISHSILITYDPMCLNETSMATLKTKLYEIRFPAACVAVLQNHLERSPIDIWVLKIIKKAHKYGLNIPSVCEGRFLRRFAV